MKTKLFLFTALLISTITFSQTTKKGYDYYKAASYSKMNKGELIEATAKEAGNSKSKSISYGSTRSNKQTRATDYNSSRSNKSLNAFFDEDNTDFDNQQMKQNSNQTKNVILRKRPGKSQGDPVPGIGITIEQGSKQTNDIHGRKRPGRTTYKNSTSNIVDNSNNNFRKKMGRTKATDYNSSRSNRTTNN